MNWRDAIQTVREKAFPRTHALECELSGLRDEHARVIAELDGVRDERARVAAELDGIRDELVQTRARDSQQLVDLQQQLTVIESDRKAIQYQARLLEKSLAEAGERQQDSEQHIKSLETRLEETHRQREAGIEQMQDSLLHLQTDQQNVLSLQTDMAKTFHEVGMQLLESVQAPMPQPRMSRIQTITMAGLLFMSGALLSSVIMRGENAPPADLDPVLTGILDLQRLMKAQYEKQDALLKLLSDKLGSETAGQDATSSSDLPEDSGKTTANSIDPLARRPADRQRADLAVLGIATDVDVDRALAEFSALYLPAKAGQSVLAPDETDKALSRYADLARKDSEKYKRDSEVLAAIRLASERTGVEFSYLMELAAAESTFNPEARASTSSAAGLYQFKADTWLDAIRAFGHKYGLADVKQHIEYVVDSKGVMRPSIDDPEMRAAVLDLRLQPRMSALLAAEQARRNMRQLSSSLERKPGRTDLYLTHFLGASGAISFLKALAEDPGQIAGEIFPGPARRNRYIFQDKARNPRTVAEIYKLFDRKFNTAGYEGS
jgi:hypothetical protein